MAGGVAVHTMPTYLQAAAVGGGAGSCGNPQRCGVCALGAAVAGVPAVAAAAVPFSNHYNLLVTRSCNRYEPPLLTIFNHYSHHSPLFTVTKHYY